MSTIIIPTDEEVRIREVLEKRTDTEAVRMKRYLSMPDLSRSEGSPVKEIVDRATKVKSLEGFDTIKIPEIVPAKILFDLFNMPEGHPARSKSDTYYADPENVLRTHDTVFWYYYLNQPEIKQRIDNKETLGVLCYGKVYRKDEIDRTHMNVFHQFGGLYIGPDNQANITPDDLKATLTEIAISIFGENTKFRFYDHNFPYTDPSFEMEAFINGKWVEMLGCGMARKSVLENFGLKGYHGWAFGFGLERLAIASMSLPDIRLLWSEDERVKKQLTLGQIYKEVSKYPAVVRDISFVVDNSFVPNDYFDLVRNIAEDLIEEVTILDKYENEQKFGKGKLSYAFRITYRSVDKTLTNEEVDNLHKAIEEATVSNYSAYIR